MSDTLPNEVLARLRALVDEQAEDDGLWFRARTAPEAYLQQEIRRLHEAIEAAIPRPSSATGSSEGPEGDQNSKEM